MYIELISTSIEGFKSISTLNFNWDTKGITRIIAPNGSGKSTIIEAMVWSLYGVLMKGGTLSSIPTKDEYKPKNYKGTRVITSFRSGDTLYDIVRHYKYTGDTDGIKGGDTLRLYSDGVLVMDDKDKSDIQDTIEDILGVNYKTFLSSVVFGQRLKRLIESGDADKREVFEYFFDISFVDTALENAKNSRQEVSDKLADISKNLLIANAELSKLEGLKQAQDNYIKIFGEQKLSILDGIEKEIQALKSIKKPKAIKEPVVVDAPTFDNSALINADIEYRDKLKVIDSLKERVAKESLPIPDTCDKCGGKVDTTKFESIRATTLKTLNKELKVGLKDLENLKATFESIKTDYDVYNGLKRDYDIALIEYNTELTKYNKYCYDLQEFNGVKDKIAQLEVKYKVESEKTMEVIDYDTKITEANESIKTLSKSEISYKNEASVYDYWVKQGFGSSGIRNFIIDSMLQYVNEVLMRYNFGMNIRVSVLLEGYNKKIVTKITDPNGIEFIYSELSGGEKSRVDLALTFALFEVLGTFRTRFNVLILDEAFENIDNEGVQVIFSMVRALSNETNIFLITFIENIDGTYVNNLYLTKENNLTKLYEES